MAITKEKAIDILERFDLFQGQRAGRELWNDKPFEVQEQDVKDFARDVALLKEYIADVVPKSEVDLYRKQVDELEDELASTYDKLENAKVEVAREIFEEIEGSIAVHAFTSKSEDYANGMYDAIEWVDSKIAELKKKYTEEKE